jgi:hypothetical protein
MGRKSDLSFSESKDSQILAHNSHTEFEINVVPTSEEPTLLEFMATSPIIKTDS